MKYITYYGDECRDYKADYNTNNFSEEELLEICNEWSKDDGIEYYLVEC